MNKKTRLLASIGSYRFGLSIACMLLFAFKMEASFSSTSGTIKFDAAKDAVPEMILSSGTSSSTLQLNGTIGFSVENISQSKSLSGNSYIFVDSTQDIPTLQLPEASLHEGRKYHIKKTTVDNHVTISANNGLIDGSANLYLSYSGNLSSVSVMAASGNWWVLDKDGLSDPFTLTRQSSSANLLAFDVFNGTDLQDVSAASSAGNGWSSGWKSDSGLTTNLGAGVRQIRNVTLSNNAFTAQGLTRSGNTYSYPGNDLLSAFRGLSTPINWDSGSTYYISFLMQYAGSHASTASQFGFKMDGSALVLFKSQGTADQLHLSLGSGATSPTPIPVNKAYFTILKIQTVSGGPDVLSVITKGPSESLPFVEPTYSLTGTLSKTGTSSVLELYNLGYKSSLIYVDELRIGTTWASVTRP